MSFQAYLDNIKLKTGKSPDDFKKLAQKKGLLKAGVKAGEIVTWLKSDFELGHGHAMAIYAVFKGMKQKPVAEGLGKYFTGGKSAWRSVFDSLMKEIREFGDDISIAPTATYLSILRGTRKMAVVQINSKRMDIGIKLKGMAATKRFVLAGTWNTMMTHRVILSDETEIDDELMNWLRSAYEQNGTSK